MSKPNIFIASSNESLSFAEAVNIKLETIGKIIQWDNAFEISGITINSLISKTKEVDYAVFVFHNDDKTFIKGDEYSTVRDNVLFELGLFIGSIGLENCFILIPKILENKFRLPTDLSGVTISYYETDSKPLDSVTASCAKIKIAINDLQSNNVSQLKDDKPENKLIEKYQSEIWNLRHDSDRYKQLYNSLLNSVNNFISEKIKPATPKEIKEWEQGAKVNYLKDIKITNEYRCFYVEEDIILPSLYGAQSISLIVKENVKIYFDDIGHNTIYYMKDFRKIGH